MTSNRYDGPMPGDPAWEAADIRGDAWVDDARAQMQAEAEERFANAEREAEDDAVAESWAGAHRYVDSGASAMALARAYHEACDDIVPPEYLEDGNDDEREVTA